MNRLTAVLAGALLFSSAVLALGEEEYKTTANQLSICYGVVMRKVYDDRIDIPAEVLDDRLKELCGFLEKREQDQFFDYIRQQLSHPLTPKQQAETYVEIYLEITLHHTLGGGRRMIVDTWKASQKPRSTPKVP